MKAKIEELASGGVAERLEQALTRVVQNIADPNTPPKAKRVITLKVVFSPNEERGCSVLDISCVEKLAPAKPIITALYTGVNLRTGEVEAVEPQQGSLFEEPVRKDNVIEMATAKEN